MSQIEIVNKGGRTQDWGFAETWLAQLAEEDPGTHGRILAEVSRVTSAAGALRESAAAASTVRQATYEAIVRTGRPVLAIREDRIVFDAERSEGPAGRLIEKMLAAEHALHEAIPLVGRIDIVGEGSPRHIGTGWLVDSEVVVTNRHVASIVAREERGTFAFRLGSRDRPLALAIDFRRELGSDATAMSPVERVLWIEPRGSDLDIAFMRVARRSDGSRRDRIELADHDAGMGVDVAVIGYPGRASVALIPDQARMDLLFGGAYGVKRIAPGRTGKPNQGALTHDCSTLGGNSGSVVLGLNDGKAVALHYAGAYLLENYAVPASSIARLIREAPWQGGSDGDFADRDSGDPQGRPAVAPAPNDIADIAHRLAGDLSHLRVLVRPGFLIRDGYLTDDECLVVSAGPAEMARVDCLPSAFEGVPVMRRVACLSDQLDFLDPSHEALASTLYDDDARTGVEFRFAAIEAEMTLTCHLGPDRGWEILSAFLAETRDELVGGIYEFHAAHVAAALEARLEAGARVSLVLGSPTRDAGGGTVSEGDFARRETFARWAATFGEGFAWVYAPQGSIGMVANAYHVKVVVRDASTVWLSSGNWNRTSQPSIAAEDRDEPKRVARAGNREWHVVVEEPSLARLMRNHLAADFALAKSLGGRLEGFADDVFVDVRVPSPDAVVEPEAAPRDVMDTFRITKQMRITPILTPDGGGRIYREAVLDLIASAERTLSLQVPYIALAGSPGKHLTDIVDALVDKSRSIQVRVIVRSGTSGLTESMELLKRKGMDIRSCVRGLARTHAKGIVADGRRVMVGSHNWSTPGLSLNRDASIIFDDPDVAAYYENAFDMDWDRSRPLRFDEGSLDAVAVVVGNPIPPGFRRIPASEYLACG